MLGTRFYRILFVSTLFSALSFLGGFVPLHAQPTPPPYDPETVPPPAQMPLATYGAALYPENCAPCHGETGLGDGPTAVDLQVQPAIFADPALIWTRAPAEFFHTTKHGRMESLMPPWRNQMSDGEIWDTVYYAWGLHTNQIEIEAGAEGYAQECASCHGESGAGDGPDAPDGLSDLSDGARMMIISPAELNQRWLDAHPELGESWSDDERRNALNYMRTFTYVPPWASPYQAGDGVVEGAVIQGTPDGGAVDGIEVVLRAFVNFAEVDAFTTTADEQGRFRFEELAAGENMVYVLETTYDDVRYGSDFFRLDLQEPQQQVDVEVFETSDDGSGVTVARTNWVIDFEPGALVIGQIATFGNESASTFIGESIEGVELPVTAAVNVPADAERIEFRDGMLGVNYFRVGDTIYDTAPLIPGAETRQMVVSYRLPMDADGGAVSQALRHPTGEVNLLVADLPDVEVTVQGLDFAQTDTIQEVPYRIWSGAELAAGTEIGVEIAGGLALGDVDPRLFAQEQTDEGVAGPTQTADPLEPIVPLAIGGLLALALAGVFVWSVRTGTSENADDALAAEKDDLIDRIAALDDSHARGEIDTDRWMAKRAPLKRQLLDIAQQLDAERDG